MNQPLLRNRPGSSSYDLSRLLARKIMNGIHSCKPALLNHPIEIFFIITTCCNTAASFFCDVAVCLESVSLSLFRYVVSEPVSPVATQLFSFPSRISFHQMKEMLEMFQAIDRDHMGHVTLSQFATYLGLPETPALKEVFMLYDRVSGSSLSAFWYNFCSSFNRF